MVPARHPIFIYVGVGAASATGGKTPLSLDHYHQFPPFVQNLRNSLPDLHVFLVLMDPYQENPPQVAVDHDLHEVQDGTYYRNTEGYYRNTEGTFQTFVYRKAVYTQANIVNGNNITETLRDLNAFAKEKCASLLYHDFSGRNIALVAEYFDRENQDHLDQLVYGLSARENHGCYFDLTQPHAFFPWRLDTSTERPVVKMFNYYKYIVNEHIAQEIEAYPPEMHHLMDIQREQIIKGIREQFKNIHLSLLRQIHTQAEQQAQAGQQSQAQAAEQQAQAGDLHADSFNQLPQLYRQMFLELSNEGEYSLLYELLFNYSASQLDILAKLKGLAMRGDELLTFITMDPDPYKWYNVMNGIM